MVHSYVSFQTYVDSSLLIYVCLSGLSRTTFRLESENAMFNKLDNKKLSLVKFWMRYDCAIEIQRDNESGLDHANSSSVPQLRTNWALEKHAR